MDARERYFWDLTGYLVVKGVLSKEEVEQANEIVDRYSDRSKWAVRQPKTQRLLQVRAAPCCRAF
jgi:hypothetical protein